MDIEKNLDPNYKEKFRVRAPVKTEDIPTLLVTSNMVLALTNINAHVTKCR